MSRRIPPLVLLALGLFACPRTSPSIGGEDDAASQVPGGAVDPGPGPAADGGALDADPGPAADGSSTPAADGGSTPSSTCRSDADCNGGVCEGQGCGDDQPGTCVSAQRMCTRDSRPYCGCDGQTFRASGTCPGRRYAHQGECSTPTPGPDGSPCLAASDCQSGVCEGQGCGDDQPGECKPVSRACTKDLRPYCGCDGTTFRNSGTCPGQRYSAPGECPAASKGSAKPKAKGALSDTKAP